MSRRPRKPVPLAPDGDEPEARHKLSAAKGLVIGGALAAAFWGAIAAVVAASRH